MGFQSNVCHFRFLQHQLLTYWQIINPLNATGASHSYTTDNYGIERVNNVSLIIAISLFCNHLRIEWIWDNGVFPVTNLMTNLLLSNGLCSTRRDHFEWTYMDGKYRLPYSGLHWSGHAGIVVNVWPASLADVTVLFILHDLGEGMRLSTRHIHNCFTSFNRSSLVWTNADSFMYLNYMYVLMSRFITHESTVHNKMYTPHYHNSVSLD